MPPFLKTYANTVFSIVLVVICFSCSNHQTSKLQLEKTGKQLLIQLELPKGITEIEVQITSNRNKPVTSRSDVSKFNPDNIAEKASSGIWYPVLDIIPEANTKGLAQFNNGTKGKYSINGMFNPEIKAFENQLSIDGVKMQYWENTLYVQPNAILKQFILSTRFPVQGKQFAHTFTLLSNNWSGHVSVYAVQDSTRRLLAQSSIQESEPHKSRPGNLEQYIGQGITRERLLESLNATVNFTLGCQDKTPNSPILGGLNLFYDLDAQTYRRPHWVWGWGPSIKLLIEASKIPECTANVSAKELVNAANTIGLCSKKFQIKDPKHPAYGIVTSRWREDTINFERNAGFEHFYSIADAQFLIGWGWMPLYHETKIKAYLDDAQLLLDATERLLGEFEIIPMDYMVSAQSWKTYTINEAGFGTEGIAKIYDATKNEHTKKVGELYMNRLLSKFQQNDGLWAKKYDFETNYAKPSINFTRGQGWAMEGLLSSQRMSPEGNYLQLAINLAEHMIANQHETGYWAFQFTESADSVGISEKGTALWSLLFYQLYKVTNDPTHLQTARKALIWCMNNQYTGPDNHAYGSIVGITPQSGVTYRPWFRLSCTYTSGFFGLALIEELKLQQQ